MELQLELTDELQEGGVLQCSAAGTDTGWLALQGPEEPQEAEQLQRGGSLRRLGRRVDRQPVPDGRAL